MAEASTIIPVAGGKGGAGKSFIAANLAIALARRGFPTVVADLDFGNSNLYSLLGLDNRYPGIGEFLSGGAGRSLADLVVPSGIPNLGFLAGDGWTPFTANLSYRQKQTLLRELVKIPAAYLLLDLGAGSNRHTLDLFSIRDRGILVTRPEQPAVVSMLVFLKNLMLRSIDLQLRGDPSLAPGLRELRRQPVSGPAWTVGAFRAGLAAHSEAAAGIDRLCARVRPRIIYNMADSVDDVQLFGRVDSTLAEVLSMKCDHIGFVPFDASVSRSLKRAGVLPAAHLAARTTDALDRIAGRIVNYWEHAIEGSAELLAGYAARALSGAQEPTE